MQDYLNGEIEQLLRRAKVLLRLMPRGLPREFHLLEQNCRGQIQKHRQTLLELQKQLCSDQVGPAHLRTFKRIVRELDALENVAVAALNRVKPDDDLWLNKLVEQIRNEIQYPLLPPVVAPLSRSYFSIYVDFALLCVPLAEQDFLLHLPDLYHELAHPLISTEDDPILEPFQKALTSFLNDVAYYLFSELERIQRKGYSSDYSFRTKLWLDCWFISWAVEIFCDLFALYSIGPAYAWAHYHLAVKRGSDPFETPSFLRKSHPADGARMLILLAGLRKMGLVAEGEAIKQRWEEMVDISGYTPDAEFQRCYPNEIFEKVTEWVYSGMNNMGCKIFSEKDYDSVGNLLNEAWNRFWNNPTGYSKWEEQKITDLKFSLTS